MGDHAFADSHLAHCNAPLVGSRLQQHGAGRSPALTHVILRAAYAPAAAGGHVAPDALAGQVLAGRDHLYFDARPIAVELFGNQLGQAGVGALAHFSAGHADDAGFVGLHHHPGIDLGGVAARTLGGGRKVKAQRQAGAGSGTGQHKGAAGQAGVCRHGHVRCFQAWAVVVSIISPASLTMWITEPTPLPVLAARWMAARMRW